MPPNIFQNQQAAQQLIQGINTMQMQTGLMPGGIPIQAPMQMQQGPTAADFSSSLRIQFQQQQQLAQLITPTMPFGGGVTPVSRPNAVAQALLMGPLNLPGPQLSFAGRNMARQQSIANNNMMLANMQMGAGVGMRAAGAMGSFAGGGILGATAFEHFGGGQFMQNMGANLMQPMINNRVNALQLQSASIPFVRGGADLSMSGMGLSMQAATRLNTGLNNMADSRSFQMETGGMFNRQDVQKISRLAGQMGMLDQAQSADEIRQSVGRISRALSNFMKVVEEPDVQEAMRMMGQMRSMGMTVPETSIAARNARMFARMAGTDVRTTMQAGMQGAGMFQQMGFTGATGMQAGMAAQGMAAQMMPMLSPQQAAMFGGRQGVQQLLTQSSAQAASMDVLLPMLVRRENGRLTIDQNMMSRMATGEFNIQEAMRTSQARVQEMGGARFLQEISTQRGELMDQISRGMGGMGQILMPAIQARMLQQSVPGMTFGAGLRASGLDENQARLLESTISDPRFRENMNNQIRADIREQRSRTAEMREQLRDYNRIPEPIQNLQRDFRSLRSRVRSTGGEFIAREFGFDQEMEEEIESQGGGELVRLSRGPRLGSAVQSAALRDRLRSRDGRTLLREQMGAADQAVRLRMQQEDTVQDNLVSTGAAGVLAEQFYGAEFGVTDVGRGGENMRQTVIRNMGVGAQTFDIASRVMGEGGISRGNIRAAQQAMTRTGQVLSRVARTTREESFNQRREIMNKLRGRGMSQDQAADLMGKAVSAVNQYAESLSPTFGINQAFDSNAALGKIQEELLRAGVPHEEVSALLQDGSFLNEVLRQGETTRSSRAQETVDRAVSASGDVEQQRRLAMRNATDELTDKTREDILRQVGVDVGYFGTSTEDQRRILDAMSGEGALGQAKRLLVMRKGAEASGDTKAVSRIQAQLDNLDLSQEDRERAEREVSGALGDISEDSLRGIGERMGSLSGEQMAGMARSAEAGMSTAQAIEQGQAIKDLVGEDAARAYFDEGMTGLRQFAEENGLEGLDEATLRKIQSGEMSEDELNRIANRRRRTGPEAAVSGGLVGAAQEALQESSLQPVLDYITRGAEGEAAPGAARGDGSFESAVGTFSEASGMLLQVAKELHGATEIVGVVGTLAQGSILGDGLNPVSWYRKIVGD